MPVMAHTQNPRNLRNHYTQNFIVVDFPCKSSIKLSKGNRYVVHCKGKCIFLSMEGAKHTHIVVCLYKFDNKLRICNHKLVSSSHFMSSLSKIMVNHIAKIKPKTYPKISKLMAMAERMNSGEVQVMGFRHNKNNLKFFSVHAT